MKVVRQLAKNLEPSSVSFWIRRPYVICLVLQTYIAPDTQMQAVEGIGVSKVCWPDRFSAFDGKRRALGRAKLDAAKKLCGVEDVFVKESGVES